MRVAQVAAQRAISRRMPGGIPPPARRAVEDDLRAIVNEHQQLWDLRSRSGGLAESCRHYTRLIRDLKP
jgi:hypothetical protein